LRNLFPPSIMTKYFSIMPTGFMILVFDRY
jgi:hypothetical protein